MFFPTSTTLWPFHGKQQTYPIPLDTAAVDPEPCLPLARHHPSSVGLYKYTIVLILYLFHLQRSSFCSRVSSFYILAASAKQLMCAECVDSNCLAIVAPSRTRLVLFPPSCDERGKRPPRWIIAPVFTNPAAFFRSILLSFRDKSAFPRLSPFRESARASSPIGFTRSI